MAAILSRPQCVKHSHGMCILVYELMLCMNACLAVIDKLRQNIRYCLEM